MVKFTSRPFSFCLFWGVSSDGGEILLCRVYESFRDDYGLNVFYDPGIFPAVKLTLDSPVKLTAQLFASGAVGITGATSAKDIFFVCKEMLYEMCKEFAI